MDVNEMIEKGMLEEDKSMDELVELMNKIVIKIEYILIKLDRMNNE